MGGPAPLNSGSARKATSHPILARQNTRLGSPVLGEQAGNISEANPIFQAASLWTSLLDLSQRASAGHPPYPKIAGLRQDGVPAGVGILGAKWLT